jgi:threonylcarbamoyladenosine tRNA methylthiotransferase MtaB
MIVRPLAFIQNPASSIQKRIFHYRASSIEYPVSLFSNMPKFKIITLGCKVNQAESEAIAGRLAAAHWSPAGAGEAADLCIVNTCAVTQRAGMQSRQALRRAIQENHGARVAATGCYAATDPQALANIAGLACVVDSKDKMRLAEVLSAGGGVEDSLWENLQSSMASRQDAAPTKKAATPSETSDQTHGRLPEDEGDRARSSLPSPLKKGDRGISATAAAALPPAGSRTRPFVKVQDGCDAFCAYCIVPYARGPSRSVAFQAVLDGVSRLSDQGYQEAVLTGIHLGAYGRDLQPQTSLAELLRAILRRPDYIRIRLSSIEPLELTDEIIDLAADSERICRHFHVPLQSGEARILKRMGRPYTPELYGERTARIHRLLPEAAIGADVLLGFPGETEADFENTLAFVEALPLTYLHVFPFSARPGTAAWALGGRVPAERIRQRCSRMRQLGARKRLAFHRRFLGRRVRVLTESRRDPQTGLLKGISSNYLPVLFEGGDDRIHRWTEVLIVAAGAVRLRGTPAD